jgi:adenine-specific DNA-methyltransferase
MNKNPKKYGGEVFTPPSMVCTMLDIMWYTAQNSAILKQHIIDNSCGDGAFLIEIVKRYATCYLKDGTADGLEDALGTYIHGIEINPENYDRCIENLDKTLEGLGLNIHPIWDVRHGNALEIDVYDGKMDYVVGNPPYVRVHNIKGVDDELYESIVSLDFCKKGSTDLYLAFYDIGFRMLSDMGTLCYISPSGWLKGPAGKAMRQYVKERRNLLSVFDFGKADIFEGKSAYTSVFKFRKDGGASTIYYDNGTDKARLAYDDVFIGDEIYLGSDKEVSVLKEVSSFEGEKKVRVKNGLATLLDNFFIYPDSKFNEMVEVPIVKASTGEEKYCFFPHHTDGTAMPLYEIKEYSPSANEYIMENEERLKNRNFDGLWYTIGRKQGLADVWRRKMAVNNIIRDYNDLKFASAPPGMAVYSGYYVLPVAKDRNIRTTLTLFADVMRVLRSEEFNAYIRALKKYKSGGYYTFTAKHLEKFINWKLGK